MARRRKTPYQQVRKPVPMKPGKIQVPDTAYRRKARSKRREEP